MHGDVRGLDFSKGTGLFEFAGSDESVEFTRSGRGEGAGLVFQGLRFVKDSPPAR